jgi:hypothetical protein
VTKPPNLLYYLLLIAIMFLWACIPARLEITPSPPVSLPIPSSVFRPSPTIAAGTPIHSLTWTPTLMPASSPHVQDSISIWRSYIGLQGQKDHLIFHVVTENISSIPLSIQILDPDTGQVTNSFPLEVSTIPNLCTAQPIKGKSYFRTAEVFFEDLPQDFWERLMGTSFTYFIEIEEPTGEKQSIAIIEPPGGCTNLVQ